MNYVSIIYILLIGEVQQALIDRAHKRREDRLQRAMELNLMRHDDEEDEDEEDLVQPNVCTNRNIDSISLHLIAFHSFQFKLVIDFCVGVHSIG